MKKKSFHNGVRGLTSSELCAKRKLVKKDAHASNMIIIRKKMHHTETKNIISAIRIVTLFCLQILKEDTMGNRLMLQEVMCLSK